MKMYVFEEVLWDYTAGMAMVLANTLEEAIEVCHREFEYSKDDWANCLAAVYDVQVTEQAQNARVAHYVYGGG